MTISRRAGGAGAKASLHGIRYVPDENTTLLGDQTHAQVE